MDEKQGWEEIKHEDLWLQANINKISFIWKPCNFNHKMYGILDQVIASRQLTPSKNRKWVKSGLVLNHLENHREITTKTGLLRSLKYYYKDNLTFIENNYTLFDSTPTSFVVNTRFETDQYTQFAKRYTDLQKNAQPFKEKMPAKHSEQNLWLIKPANENQGKGIKIMNDIDQIFSFLQQSVKFSYWVIQKYIEKPLLYKGRKFDIRVWAFSTNTQDLYFYNVGYLRTSSIEFTTKDMADVGIHLTNNCL